jgi:hypothetical protein
MDLKGYYRKVRELEATMTERDVLVISLPTPEGGKEGEATEVPKLVGCQLIVEGKARQATAEEIRGFRKRQQEALEALERERARGRLQIGLVSEQDLKNIQKTLSGARGPSPEAS